MRTRTKYNPKASVYEYTDPIQYVKDVLDSKTPSVDGWDLEGHTILSRRYSNLQDENAKRTIAKAIVQLLDDPDYSCDAIPAAAELALEEAKEWFSNLSRKPIDEIRKIKTNNYTNGFGCLTLYSDKHSEFLPFLKELVRQNTLTPGEFSSVIYRIAKLDSNYILSNYKEFLEKELSNWNENMGSKQSIINFTLVTALENIGLEKCLDIARKMKREITNEIQRLYYDSLRQLPRFKPYLEELKKILEISD